ncbi:unnamed protein product [Sympodiomycopsis kandeliae]
MFPSQAVHSGMPTGKKYMGWWGAMGGPQQKGITSYTISANEQQPMRGALRQYLFYGYKRTMKLAPKFVIPFLAGYGLIAWAKERNHYLNSKAGKMEYGDEE